MRNSRLVVGIAVLGLAGLALGQGPRGRAGQPGAQTRGGQQVGLDMSKAAPLSGVVTAVNIAYGMQFPSVELDKAVIVKVAPVWFLIENDFEIKAGDKLNILAAPSLSGDPYLHAIEIENVAANKRLVVRDAQGLPGWGGRGRGARGERSGSTGLYQRGACIDPASITTITGAIDKVVMGTGIELPYIIVKTSTELVTVKIGPERILLENDFEINPGEQLTVEAARCTVRDELVALSITNAAGVKIVLRTADGTPAW